jgi:integrase/recombinase XerD
MDGTAGAMRLILFKTSALRWQRFNTISEKLLHKLNRSKRGNRTKKALSPVEMKRLLIWLSEDKTELGLENYALFFVLATSGLRASELAQIRWKDIECFKGKWTAKFIGKGGLESEQELYEPALMACAEYFRKTFHRIPKLQNNDYLFYTVPSFSGEEWRPLTKRHTIWARVKKIGMKARESAIIKRELVFSLHLLRRSYATGLYKSGMGIKAIQHMTRHASVETPMKHYVYDDELATPYLDKLLEVT